MRVLAPTGEDIINLLILLKIKLDSSFQQSKFHVEGYSKAYRLDRDRMGEELYFFVRDGGSSKLLAAKFGLENQKSVLVELNWHKKKWLIICI